MEWIFALILAPAMFAAVNHIDSNLLNQQKAGIKALIVFSSLIGLVAALLILIFNFGEIFSLDGMTVILLIVVGIFEIVSIVFYLYAMNEEETSLVAPLMQMISVLGLILGFFFFGEVPTSVQLLGAVLIIASGAYLNITEEEDGKLKFNKKVFFLMIGASIFFALGGVVFKLANAEPSFWVASFWQHVSLGLCGVVLLLFGSFRREFKAVFKKNTKAILGFSALNEVLNVGGNMLLFFTLLLAPVGLVYLGESTQPMFVLLFGVLLAKFFPDGTNERMGKKEIIRRTVAILGIVLGGILVAIGA